MAVDTFLNRIKTNPDSIDFNELMSLIDAHYDFTPSAFKNGDLQNAIGENSGSCKLFSFAQLHGLDQQQTLSCFGAYYREDVLLYPEEDNHKNIRNFMKTAWEGIRFDAEALSEK